MADGKQEAIRRAVRAGLGLRLKKALPLGEALAFRIVSCIFLAKFMVYLFCGLARPFYWEGGGNDESYFCLYDLRRSKRSVTLCLQVA